jgi:hypothetical protein
MKCSTMFQRYKSVRCDIYFSKKIFKIMFFNNKKITICDTLKEGFSSVGHGDNNLNENWPTISLVHP